mgnify:CR=1 FL=1
MATTPLIKTPQADGGTFYTFSSSAKDLSRTLNNDDLKLVFSKFVLLDLPDMDSLPLNFGNYQNYMQYDTIDGAIQNAAISSDPNVNFTQSLQNYMLNIEEMIISDAGYDNTTNLTVTERVFFKWLKETGAMRFREATVLEKAGSVTTPRFVEEDQSLSGTREYRPVVKYIGGIDIVNNVDKAGEAYTELYINVPTEVGNTPTILFNSVSDTNYQPGLTIQGTSEFILGRTSATVHPQGLNIKAFYDYDDQLQGLNSAGYTDPAADWMGLGPGVTSPITNAYFTEPVTFTSALNVPIVKYAADYNNPGTYDGSAYERSQLDGISVDFDANDYQQIVTDASISTIPQFNGTALAETFEFNSVLVYYDMVDLSDSTKTTTNLYGILLLDNVTATPSGGFVQRYPKYKPNLTTGQNGNSYGFKINLRFDASPGSAGIDTIINDYNTFSMGFHDANFNEAEDAKKIAKFLGTNHQEIYVSDQEARDVIPTLASIYSEPFGDSSQIPTYLLSKLARSHVTVALTGDAGDEIFGGYNRYSLGSSMFKKLSFLPGPLKQMLGSSLESISPETLDRLAKFIPGLSHLNLIGDKTHKFARGLRNSHSFDAFYKNLILTLSLSIGYWNINKIK